MAHYPTFQDLLKQGSGVEVKGTPVKKREVADKRSWFKMKDGSVVEVEKGDPIPDVELVEKSTVKAKYDEYLASLDKEAGED